MSQPFDFVPGDIIEHCGECYQVIENLGDSGLVRLFPSDDENSFSFDWNSEGVGCRKIGQAALPAPSPCSTGGSCPTYEIKPKAAAGDHNANIIASDG